MHVQADKLYQAVRFYVCRYHHKHNQYYQVRSKRNIFCASTEYGSLIIHIYSLQRNLSLYLDHALIDNVTIGPNLKILI